MMINDWELKTIQDALCYCMQEIAKYHDNMTREGKESLAWSIVDFSTNDHFSQWRKEYPVVDEIQAFAVDLSWSNSLDIDEDWEKLKGFIDELDRQVNGVKK